MKAYIFPGQGAQFPGMGLDLYENSPVAKELFEAANEILGLRLNTIHNLYFLNELRRFKIVNRGGGGFPLDPSQSLFYKINK